LRKKNYFIGHCKSAGDLMYVQQNQ